MEKHEGAPGVRLNERVHNLRVCHEYVHAVFGILLVFTLRFEHETLQYVVVPRDDAVRDVRSVSSSGRGDVGAPAESKHTLF